MDWWPCRIWSNYTNFDHGLRINPSKCISIGFSCPQTIEFSGFFPRFFHHFRAFSATKAIDLRHLPVFPGVPLRFSRQASFCPRLHGFAELGSTRSAPAQPGFGGTADVHRVTQAVTVRQITKEIPAGCPAWWYITMVYGWYIELVFKEIPGVHN